MATANSKDSKARVSDLVITRVFDAPRALVWKAFTDPEQVMRWWGPEHFSSPTCQIDLRVGGKYLFCMRDPDGKDYYSTGTYQKIDPINEIVYTDSFSNEKGEVIPASEYGMVDFPLEMLVTLTFQEIGGKTRLTVVQAGHPEGEMREMAEAGWNTSLDKLALSLA
jgi:uncharacterized protein YndB with AHSA1/START domain